MTHNRPPRVARFNQYAYQYNKYAMLQQQSARTLLDTVVASNVTLLSAVVLDAGAGTGALSIPLARQGARVWAVDASENMLAQLPHHIAVEPIHADIRALPFPDAMVDMVVSNFCLHWCTPDVLVELVRVTRKQGHLFLALPVQGSLQALAHQYTDFPIYNFLPEADWLLVLQQQGLRYTAIVQEYSMPCQSLREAMRWMSQMGGTIRASASIPKSLWQTWLAQDAMTDAKSFDFTYRVLHLHVQC